MGGKLGIKPFSYGLAILKVYEGGSMFDPKVLDITDADLMASFGAGLRNVAAIPHLVINGFKNVLAVSLETDYTFPHAQKVKDFLANPSAFAVAAPLPMGPRPLLPLLLSP